MNKRDILKINTCQDTTANMNMLKLKVKINKYKKKILIKR